jgi:hypothetical protein
MQKIFISYSKDDAAIAKRLKAELSRGKQRVWLDRDSLRAGEKFVEVIGDAIRSSAAVIVLLSRSSRNSDYVTYEWAFALGAKVHIIPVIVRTTELHPCLRAFHRIDFANPKTRRWEELAKNIASSIAARGKRLQTSGGDSETERTDHKPLMSATFDLHRGKPRRVHNEYVIKLRTKNVPEDSKKATYEILDDSFADNPFTVEWGHRDFEDTIQSYGDVFIRAWGKAKGREWRTFSKLSDALQRGHRGNMTPAVARALADLRLN